MTVYGMIEFLSGLRDKGHGTDEVTAWDPDAKGYLPVCGAYFGDGKGTVELSTEEP